MAALTRSCMSLPQLAQQQPRKQVISRAGRLLVARAVPECSTSASQQYRNNLAGAAGAAFPIFLLSDVSAALADEVTKAVDSAVDSAGSAVSAAADAAADTPGLSPVQAAVLASPLLLYGIFNAYRAMVNPQASFNDFAFLVVTLLILANIFSIVVLKTRLV